MPVFADDKEDFRDCPKSPSPSAKTKYGIDVFNDISSKTLLGRKPY